MDVGRQGFGAGALVRNNVFGMDPALRRAGLAPVPAPDASASDMRGSACCIVLSIDRIGMIAAACGDLAVQQVRDEIRHRIQHKMGEFLDGATVDADDAEGNFVLHVGGNSRTDMERHVGLLIDRLTRRPVITDWGDIYVTLSAGGVVSAIAKVGSRWMVAWANHALGDARRLGGNRVKIGTAADHLEDWFRRAMWIVGRVCDAHAAGRVSMSYQPVVGRNGEVFYYECLLRAVDEFGDQLLPAEFVPVMEQMGAIGWIDRFVFERIVGELEEDADVVLGCNVSGQSVSDPGWTGEVVERLSGSPDIARRLVIEITETASITDIAAAANFVSEMREIGCRVALDDFGVGFASFAHLRMLDVDIVKLDQTFLEDRSGTAAWLRGIEHLAGLVAKVGAEIVVEGIQTPAQLDVLDLEDVTYFQGYCLGAPSPKRPWKESGPRAAPSPQDLRETTALKTGAA